jgi:ABC-type enterochelin transport system permease subunit
MTTQHYVLLQTGLEMLQGSSTTGGYLLCTFFVSFVVCSIVTPFLMFYVHVCRCDDANLIDVPMLVGRLDRNFYRLAFFMKRRIEPLEELTWDYGNDFSRENPDLLYFECKCGNRICRGKVKRGCSCSL